jgi:putative methyltransferase (TIGR04325 family)
MPTSVGVLEVEVSAKQLLKGLLELGPGRRLLGALGKSERGKWLLRQVGGPRAVYDSFDAAWKAAGRDRHPGHDHPDAISTHLELARTLRPSDYAALFWLLQCPREELHVFDFGGNAGNLYYSYIGHMRQRFRDCHWTVFDLPSVCQEGARIALRRKAKNLCFTQSFGAAASADVLLISGALHYWEGSIPEFLRQFERLPERVLVNRTPVHARARSFITVQQTESYAVPCIVRNRREMVEGFLARGYKLLDEWRAMELSLTLPLFPELNVPHYSGFYFEREPSEAV